MAEPDQPKKETVRIHLPHPPVTKPSPSLKPAQTVRIQLPVREMGGPPAPPSRQPAAKDVSSNNFLPPKPPTALGLSSASMRPALIPSASGPKRETVRIPLTSEPLRSAQKKTQPLIAMPNVVPQMQNAPIAVAPVEKKPMLVYWMLLALSTLILIIQIWTYFS